jgi:hypothetical protein
MTSQEVYKNFSNAELLQELFVNRPDCYAKQYLKKDGKKKGFYTVRDKKTKQDLPIDVTLIKKHLEGNSYDCLGVYQLNKTNFIKWIALDFDQDTEEDFKNAFMLYDFLKKKGFHPALENSGGGKYKTHLWIFFKPTPAINGKKWIESICKEANIYPHEIFPKQDEIGREYGNLVKLPLGMHFVTKEKSFFYSETKELVNDILLYHLNNLDEIPITEKQETLPTLPALLEQSRENITEIKEEDNKTESIIDENKITTELKYSEWHDFFDYVLNNELPQGNSVKTNNPKIVGVNDNILKNLAIYFWYQGYSLSKLEEEIKPIYDSKGWDFTHLKGWFKKVILAKEGKYRNIGRAEIVIWAKLFKPETLKLIPYEEWCIRTEDIELCYKHLPNFELIDEILNLEGNIYYGTKKEIYNTCISLSIPTPLKTCKIGGMDIDLRKHTLFFKPSGKGKLNTKEAIKKIFLAFNNDGKWEEPQNINKDQMLGKILQRWEDVPVKDINGNKVYDKNNVLKIKKELKYSKKWGFIFKDIFCLEEVYSFLNSKDKNEEWCRNNLTVGLDIFGKNYIKKDNIDNADVDEETLAGYPHCICIAFCQPLPMQEEIVTKGLMRRFNILYRKFPLRTNLDAFKKRRERPKDTSKSINQFADFMKSINGNLKGEWDFKDNEAENTFDYLHKVLLEEGFMQKGKKANYTSILEFPLQNQLLQFSCFKAAANLRTTIEKADIEAAFIDIIERFVWELEFIETKVIGTLDYENTLSRIEGKKAECWEWLYNSGAINEEKSNVKIELFQNQIMKIINRGNKTARNTYAEMKKEGLIEDKPASPIIENGTITDHKPSRVWIKHYNSNHQIEENPIKQPFPFFKPLEEYLNIISKLNHGGNTGNTGNAKPPH